MDIEITPKTVFKILTSIILLLLVANLIGVISHVYFGHGRLYGFIPLFNFDAEKNIPTLYSSIALIIASLLLAAIARWHKMLNQSFLYWAFLSAISFFLAIDEISSIHEQLVGITKHKIPNSLTTGIFYFSWIIPYGILLISFIIGYSKFLLSLPKNIMILFMISGSIFVLGAIGMEMIGGARTEFLVIATPNVSNHEDLLYSLAYTLEEFFEMFGIALFIFTLLSYISTTFGQINLSLKKQSMPL